MAQTTRDDVPEKPKQSDWMVPVWIGASALATVMIVAIVLQLGYGINVGQEIATYSQWLKTTTAEERATGSAGGAIASLQETITAMQSRINALLAGRGGGGSSAPEAAEAEPPALRQPKNVEWDGKTNKLSRETAPQPKAAPVEQPKLGKPAPTSQTFEVQPVKPSGKAETGKQERQGKETRP
jgi:hypothetical protein